MLQNFLKILFLSVFYTLLLIRHDVKALEIVNRQDPMYINYGEPLDLHCESPTLVNLEWSMQTRNTAYNEQVIVPGQNYTVKSCTNEPSGLEESKMEQRSMKIEDIGIYTCRDESKSTSYSVYITVLKIKAPSHVKATPSHEYVELQCNITGFEYNPPPMEFSWKFGGKFINRDYIEKYSQMMRDRSAMLVVLELAPEDSGVYECSIMLGTSEGTHTISHNITLDAAEVITGTCSQHSSSITSLVISLLLYALCIIVY